LIRNLTAAVIFTVLGDTLLKVPGVYANKGYRNLGWVGPQAARVQQFCPRILTPPYVSTKAFVAHVELSASDRYLILASDGLSDFFHGISLDRASRYWIEAMMTETWDGPLSLRILRHALGGDDLDSISKWLTLEHPSDTWLDDTTITVMRLGAR
jgi:pyruvate dehydrogenase phosphatase